MHARPWLTLIVLTSALLLSGCARGGFRPLVAPPVLDYSDSVQDHAADEMAATGPPCARDAVFGGCSAVKRFVLDYHWMREQLRAVE